jgi:hypothetical protein
MESEMSGPSELEPTVCPKCRSSKVSANSKIAAHTAHHAVHAVRGVAGLVLAGALWLAAKGMNAATHDWKCGACGHEFSQSPSGCRRCTSTAESLATLNCCGTAVCSTCLNELAGPGHYTCGICGKPLVRK